MSIGLYIHIPFCIRKCNYCDFVSYEITSEKREKFIKNIIKEMKLYSDIDKVISSIFIGGGTPTILNEIELEYILSSIGKYFKIKKDAEITIESNPGTLSKEKLKVLYSLGVNRLSIGLQAYQDKHLRLLGRIHTFKEFEENFQNAVEAGFENINVDLMFSLPDQTINEWVETLQKVVSLNPKHISAYSLIIEEGTKLYDIYESNKINIDENLDRKMYYFAKKYLKENGYKQYEISNFAKDGYECKHNIIYWKTKEYIGLGPSAHSYLNGIRFSNFACLDRYCKELEKGNKPIQEKIKLTEKEKLEETIFMGLRMNEGIDMEKINKKFGIDFIKIYGETINKLIEKGYIKLNNNNISLTDKGIDLSNKVFIEFLQD
ncbi:oxygen-independent coproporphyrinogen-3 oxidase [Alkalithermobacter thermoalcaliphilus JW-YL-7 = DSM 7308]|uniref:Heme chaperone HemW n=1 Tax=Alkalithermobacter thermoalcaliphilus JW-YL-7 = DSM 7308 TaxID=1121328 RepID=A0A150FR73_CLOPD|nr:oxygen-independent coproporphyrinogen III oxidase [[Clostridium] paradoxum JW-YL-7 = DSM 7308]SHL01323.1 oxygen-independent coproporphyrinogen-3 oxidase [[Clostridium] paradoxum JW-YL-7 = DSM 7308]